MADEVLAQTTSDTTACNVAKRQLRFVSGGYVKWHREIQPQPEFGENLERWLFTIERSGTQLAEALGCTPATVRKWLDGHVPGKEYREKLLGLGFDGEFWPWKWSQDMFLHSELVEMKNTRWQEGMDPKRQTLQKYMIHCRMPKIVASGRGKARKVDVVWVQAEVLFTTRVTDVIEIISKGDALTDWTVCQALAEAIGEPVLRGICPNKDGVLEQVEIRGTWKKIRFWEKKCHQSTIEFEIDRSRVKPWSWYSKGDLLEIHREAFNAKYRKRDEAGEFGTRAHKLGQAWIQYHAIQDRDPETGAPTIDRIRAPKHFWSKDPNETSEEIVDQWMAHEPIEVQNAIKALQIFWLANVLHLVAVEELLADLVHGVAGAVDCVVRDRHGKLVIIDWKTSNNVYSSMLVQVSWYAHLWSVCKGEMPDRAYIVRLDKLTAAVQVVPVFDNPVKREKRLRTALLALELKRDNDEMEAELDQYGPEEEAA